MKILYGTGNEAKLGAMQRRLAPLGIELMGLRDLNRDIPVIEECGKTPLENARIKAKAYYKEFQMPVFSCDSGLYFEQVPREEQPAVHVRTVNGHVMSDEEMVQYYVSLARKYPGLTARYKNAICFVYSEKQVFEAMDETMESKPFLITDQIRPIRRQGFPLDSISVDIKTKKHFYDLEEMNSDIVAVEDGFIDFFDCIMKKIYNRK